MNTHDFEKLKQKVNALEKEVERLSKALGDPLSPAADSRPVISEPLPDEREHVMDPPKKQTTDLETLIGQVWLPRIFIIVLLLGCIFGFKVASDNHLLSPSIRILLGYAGAALLFLAGFWQVRKDRSRLGMILFGGTVVLLMLTTFACHYLYHFIPPSAAFLINVLSICIGLGLSYFYKSQYLAVFVGIGGYLLPFLLDNTNPNVLVFAVYESLLYLVLFLFAASRDYRILYYSSIFLLNLTFFAASIFSLSEISLESQTRYFATGVLVQHVALLLSLLISEQKGIFGPSHSLC